MLARYFVSAILFIGAYLFGFGRFKLSGPSRALMALGLVSLGLAELLSDVAVAIALIAISVLSGLLVIVKELHR